jgi:sugar/nucleoside kinase (ribokinase family)
MTPTLLIAGHIAKDVTADGWRPGGGVLYAAAQALALGLDVAAITACADDIDPTGLLPDVAWHVQPSEETTSFENDYTDGRRSQRLLALADFLHFDELPDGWLDAPVKFLTPLFHEIEPSRAAALASRDSLLGVGAQGWLRELDGDRVNPMEFDGAPAWLAGDAVFLSAEDVNDPEAVASWREQVPVVALTRGRDGCTVWDSTGRHEISAAATHEEDPTGAGDVFAVAFMLRFRETHHVLESARFAAAAGALSVHGRGFKDVATRAEIEALLARGQVRVA